MTRNRRPSRTIEVVFRFGPVRSGRRSPPRTPEQALARLHRGNRQFAQLLDPRGPRVPRVIPRLRSIVDAILVAVRSASLALEAAHGPRVTGQPGYRAALVETSVALNACLAAFALKQELGSPTVRVVFGSYDLASRSVRLPLAPAGRSSRPEIGFFAPPDRDDELRDLAVRLAGSASIASLLRTGGGAHQP